MKPDDGLGGWAEYEDLENDDMSLIPWDAFRSADMSQLSISFPDDGDLPHAVIKALAETKNCQFEDMFCVKSKDGKEQAVPFTQRRFRREMQTAQDCGRVLRILRDEISTMWERGTIGDGNEAEETEFTREGFDEDQWWLMANDDGVEEVRRQNLQTAKERLSGWLESVTRSNNVIAQYTTDLNRFIEERNVLEKSDNLLRELVDSHAVIASGGIDEESFPLSPTAAGKVALLESVELQATGDLEANSLMGGLGHIGHIVGCLPLVSLEGMRMKLYTAMRSLAIVKHHEIEEDIRDPATGDLIKKCVFVVYYHGQAPLVRLVQRLTTAQALSDKILRFAKAFGATIYTPPETQGSRGIKMAELREAISARDQAMQMTLKDKYRTLQEFYQHAITLKRFITQEKLIYYTLNKCSDRPEDGAELENRTITRLRANVWVPDAAITMVKKACQSASRECMDAGNATGDLVLVKKLNVKPDVVRPTFSPTNRFTEGFQAIVDGYGIPDYKEVNPTIFATAMFPFLFGVMFGDFVHGTMMVIFAGLLIFYEKKLNAMEERNEIFDYLFSGRYTIFVMGICATYMGLIYNEALSCSMDLFGSAYHYSYFCSSSFGGTGVDAPYPEFGGIDTLATGLAGETQVYAEGCTVETLARSTSNCWHLLGEEKYFEQLPCGVNSQYPCPDEIIQRITDKTLCPTAPDYTAGTSIMLKMEPFVVPSDHGERGFLPSDVGQPHSGSEMNNTITEGAAKAIYTPYIFGVDPVWRYSSQNIQFTNSLKMKMSVILGVSQMIVGILLKWFNVIHFKKWGEFVAVCIPELLFMTCTFGYMCFLIFIKWSTNYTNGWEGGGELCFASCPDVEPGCYREPPMIITTLIGMFMSMGAVGQDQTVAADKCKFYLFESQESVQVVFLIIALICVPWLFVVEPVLVYREHTAEVEEREHRGLSAHTSEDSAEENEDEDEFGEVEEDQFSMGDVIVGQAIHAIEFILGAVSNTASYLRLWALSLAHSQLSEVFWEYIFKGYEIELLGGQYPGIASGSVAFIFVCYAVFFACTIAVLMVMESLSAFLHALRLQWVEFQNKFYHATGYKFSPLDFDDAEMPFDMENN